MDKLLIIAAKLYNDSTGGGGTVVKSLLDTFLDDYQIDLLLYRTPVKSVYSHPNLKTYFFPVCHRDHNKFKRRLDNVENNIENLTKNFDLTIYHKILVIHVSKMFGFEKLNKDVLNKTILFPMYLTPSYQRSNEVVPIPYIELERKALSSASIIITPSQSEKDDITEFYQIDESKVIVVERSIADVFSFRKKENIPKMMRMITVSTIKPQKNVIESCEILRNLRMKQIEAQLTVVGNIESPRLFQEIIDYVRKHDLIEHVRFLSGLSSLEVAQQMQAAHILILPSLWETFGRVVYEGLAVGLPAIIRADINCFESLYKQDFIFSYRNIDEATTSIIGLKNDCNKYLQLSYQSSQFASNFQAKIESNRLKEIIT